MNFKSFILVATLASTVAISALAEEQYHFLKEIPIHTDGGWDYLSVDSSTSRLYVSHGTKVVVIDIAKDSVIGEITNTPGVHGIAIAEKAGLGLVTCGRENKAALVDLKSMSIITKADTGENPDGMCFDSGKAEFYTFNGKGQSATVIDTSGKVVATIPLGAKPEFPQADPAAGRVFDNLEDLSTVVAIDTATHTVANRWPVAPGEFPCFLPQCVRGSLFELLGDKIER